MVNSTDVRLGSGAFTPVPNALTSHPITRPPHITTFVALWNVSDWTTLRGVIKDQRAFARRARLSLNTIFGIKSRNVKGTLAELVGLGFVEILGKSPNKHGVVFLLHPEATPELSRVARDNGTAANRASRDGKSRVARRQIARRATPPIYIDSFQILSDGAAELPPDDVAFKDPIGQKAVQHYVDTCMEIGYSPTEEWKSLCGRNAKKLDNSGKTLDLIWSAIERVARGRKSPSALLHVAADIEAGIPESGNYPTNGRNGYKPFRDRPLSEWEDPKNHVIG